MTDVLPRPLWDFAVGLYRQPAIEAQCIQLQDEYQVRVPILLFICWLDVSGKWATPEALAAVLRSTEKWHEHLVVPLRDARRWIKSQAPLDDAQQLCREQIKAVELAAEHWEIQQLSALSRQWPAQQPAPLLPQVRDYLIASQLPPSVLERTLALLYSALATV